MSNENDGPDVSDGYDYEGFIGGCERMRCPGYMKLQQENERLREALIAARSLIRESRRIISGVLQDTNHDA